MSDAILCGHRGNLSGQIVTAGVQAGSSFSFFGSWTGGKLRVGAVRGELSIGEHTFFLGLEVTWGTEESGFGAVGRGGLDLRQHAANIGDELVPQIIFANCDRSALLIRVAGFSLRRMSRISLLPAADSRALDLETGQLGSGFVDKCLPSGRLIRKRHMTAMRVFRQVDRREDKRRPTRRGLFARRVQTGQPAGSRRSQSEANSYQQAGAGADTPQSQCEKSAGLGAGLACLGHHLQPSHAEIRKSVKLGRKVGENGSRVAQKRNRSAASACRMSLGGNGGLGSLGE
jgi:hypothetical protein